MKKLLLIVSVLSLVSCVTPTEERIADEERIAAEERLKRLLFTNYVHKIDYEGHTYLLLDPSYSGQNGMCHDENCKCKNK